MYLNAFIDKVDAVQLHNVKFRFHYNHQLNEFPDAGLHPHLSANSRQKALNNRLGLLGSIGIIVRLIIEFLYSKIIIFLRYYLYSFEHNNKFQAGAHYVDTY